MTTLSAQKAELQAQVRQWYLTYRSDPVTQAVLTDPDYPNRGAVRHWMDSQVRAAAHGDGLLLASETARVEIASQLAYSPLFVADKLRVRRNSRLLPTTYYILRALTGTNTGYYELSPSKITRDRMVVDQRALWRFLGVTGGVTGAGLIEEEDEEEETVQGGAGANPDDAVEWL